jgi:hypothetical protein
MLGAVVAIVVSIGWLWFWGRPLFDRWDHHDTFTKGFVLVALAGGVVCFAGGLFLLFA